MASFIDYNSLLFRDIVSYLQNLHHYPFLQEELSGDQVHDFSNDYYLEILFRNHAYPIQGLMLVDYFVLRRPSLQRIMVSVYDWNTIVHPSVRFPRLLPDQAFEMCSREWEYLKLRVIIALANIVLRVVREFNGNARMIECLERFITYYEGRAYIRKIHMHVYVEEIGIERFT